MSKYIEILADASRSVYIPQYAAKTLQQGWWSGLPDWVTESLRDGPANEEYWEAWDRALKEARFCDHHGSWWMLHHDGDLFAVRTDIPQHVYENAFGS